MYIPTSATDIYQPLDKVVFGVLKSQAVCYYDDHVFEKNQGLTKPQAAKLFLILWSKLPTSIVQKAWEDNDNFFLDDEEELDDSNDGEFNEEECLTVDAESSTECDEHVCKRTSKRSRRNDSSDSSSDESDSEELRRKHRKHKRRTVKRIFTFLEWTYEEGLDNKYYYFDLLNIY